MLQKRTVYTNRRLYLLVLEERMVGWKPKTSKTGGLPNCSYEPRKPVDYGTMLRDSAECVIGMIMHVDPVMCPEKQALKKFASDNNPLPNVKELDELLVHVSEVLRQVENSKVPADGWAGGDTWFGSITAAVVLKKRKMLTLLGLLRTIYNFSRGRYCSGYCVRDTLRNRLGIGWS